MGVPKDPDPAHVAQVLLQLQATGASYGILAYWARSGLSMFRITYSAGFIKTLAIFLAAIIKAYINVPSAAPLPSGRIKDMTEEIRGHWNTMMISLNDVVGEVQVIERMFPSRKSMR